MTSSRPANLPNLDSMPVELFWQMAEHLPVEALTSLRTVSRGVSARALQPFAQCGLSTVSMTLDAQGYGKLDEIANHEFYQKFPQRLAMYPPDGPCDWTNATLCKLGQTLEHQLAQCREVVLYYGMPDPADRLEDMLGLHVLCRMLAAGQIHLHRLVLFQRQAPQRRAALELLAWPRPYLPPNIASIWAELRQLHVYEPEDNAAIDYVRALLPTILQNAPQLEDFKHVVSPRLFLRDYVIPVRCAIWAGEDASVVRAPAPLKRVEVAGTYINLADLMGFLARYGPTLERVQICVTYAHGSSARWSEVLAHMKEVCPVLRYVSVVTCRRSLGCVESEDRGRMLEALDRMIEMAEQAGI
ncbi:hypothetical protein BO99DRAFT_165834 [Aspergillus violaceofuscus CBS 115571]|uniref:F-box domain-containing protein n=1 Tax=Aspergillus violaceofuscus (strain CBS 115571) TaxID=1450538 RepID=A0A2V5H371_ASPV1|nr:hypothetical protein BO99DRAFT_165834 [Aspergillus violaceofuscus CBS 115571]